MSTELMRAFDFTGDDLALNRAGQLSPRQTERVRRRARNTKIRAVVFGLIAGVIAIYLLLPFILALSVKAAGVGQLIGGLVLAGLSLLLLSEIAEKPRTDVQSAQGKAQFLRRESTDVDGEGQPIGTTTQYYVVIGEHEFTLQRADYEAFTQGHVYNIYFLTGPTEVLSIEYVGPPET
jgi:hypothetical protein